MIAEGQSIDIQKRAGAEERLAQAGERRLRLVLRLQLRFLRRNERRCTSDFSLGRLRRERPAPNEPDLLRSVGVEVRSFGNVSDFLAAGPPDGPCCVVADVRLPGQSGLDLQAQPPAKAPTPRSAFPKTLPRELPAL